MATTTKIAPAAKPQSQPMPTAAKSSPAAAPALAGIGTTEETRTEK